MGHKVAEAIIENGELTYVDTKLPKGKIMVHIIYDAEEEKPEPDPAALVRESAGLYQNIDAGNESKKLRTEWERNVRN